MDRMLWNPIDLVDLVESLLHGRRDQLLEVRMGGDLLDLPTILLHNRNKQLH